VIKALAKIGFEVTGKKGSHIKLKKKFNGKVFIVIIPDHPE
jgi:predicted RNA binding protein YcfA (HicA-like mRNA interferase family)